MQEVVAHRQDPKINTNIFLPDYKLVLDNGRALWFNQIRS